MKYCATWECRYPDDNLTLHELIYSYVYMKSATCVTLTTYPLLSCCMTLFPRSFPYPFTSLFLPSHSPLPSDTSLSLSLSPCWNRPKRKKESSLTYRGEERMTWHEQGNMKAAMEELIRGQEQATRLQFMLKDMLPPENPSGPAADLLIEVLSSFSKALSLLDLGSSAEANSPSSNGGVRRKMQSPRRVSCRGRYIYILINYNK